MALNQGVIEVPRWLPRDELIGFNLNKLCPIVPDLLSIVFSALTPV